MLSEFRLALVESIISVIQLFLVYIHVNLAM